MKNLRMTAALAAALGALCSCNILNSPADDSLSENGSGQAVMTVSIKGSTPTKADAATISGEDNLGKVQVYVFNADRSSVAFGLLESYKEAETGEISGNNAKVTLNTTTGMKHVYVVANPGSNSALSSPEALESTIREEADFLGAISSFADNSRDGFIMVGSGCNSSGDYQPVLSAGPANSNNISVQCKRLVARIKIESIQGAFTSPALQNSSFRIKRVYLMNVPRQAKYVNGDWTDVFGAVNPGASAPGGREVIPPISTLLTGSSLPSGFVPAGDLDRYYRYSQPRTGDVADGFWNWTDPSGFHEGDIIAISPSAASLTAKTDIEGGGQLYSSPSGGATSPADHKRTLNHYFYCYPNPSAPAEVDGETDNTTKLIIETELIVNGSAYTYYYPISIPYVQPNYAYTIGKVTIKRLGSTDPFHPVTTAECSFDIKVRAWDSGDISGDFNNEDPDHNDEFII